MLCNYGYDVERCFDCPYGNSAHIPEGYEGWTNTVIKDTLVNKSSCLCHVGAAEEVKDADTDTA